mmetsp:Transcript_15340/g.43687  ORF Transcript_15340/g.43687 Transcript_15340/m.43687 type:complete len:114 (-) Transcript_15340:66-407(-)
MRLLLPAPFGPTTAVKFWRSLKSTVCVPPKDLKPSISNFTMRPRGCSTSMSAIALFESLLVCFGHCYERGEALERRGSPSARLCGWAVLRASRLFERLAVRGRAARLTARRTG